MHTLKQSYDYFSLEADGRLCRNVVAQHKHHEDLLFYKEYSDGKAECRNLYTSCYGGYCIAFPGERYSKYMHDIAEIETWGECNKINLATSKVTEADKITIEAVYPDFKYVLKKWKNPTKAQVMEIIPIWEKHPETETLLALGLYRIVTNKCFWKLSQKKKVELRTWLKNNKDFDITGLSLKDMQVIIKHKISFQDWKEYLEASSTCYCKLPYETFRYFKEQIKDRPEIWNISNSFYAIKRIYDDYIDAVKKVGHDLRDKYWKYPKDLRGAHDKVMEELKILEANRAKEKFMGLDKAIERYTRFNCELEGYSIVISSSQEEWTKQAETLHQCIVRMNYMKRVLDRKILLVFILKDGEPVATAELYKGKRIGQFYGNEQSRDIFPSEEVKAVFEKWLKTLPKNILQEREKKSA